MNTLLKDWQNARRVIARKYNQLRQMDDYRYCHWSFAAREAINWYSRKYNVGCGAEGAVHPDNCRAGIEYLNMGDTYDTTVLFDGSTWRITTWGDYVERHSEYCS